MKYTLIVIVGCSAGFAVATPDYGFPDIHEDFILGARSESIIPRSYHLQIRARGVGLGGASARPEGPHLRQSGLPRQSASQRKVPTPGQVAGQRTPASSQNSPQQSGEDRSAKASIKGTGAATMHATTPTDFRDTYLMGGRSGRLAVGPNHMASAGGNSRGPADDDAATRPLVSHPLQAKAEGRSVMGHVTAPEGGRAAMRIKTSEGKRDYHVEGGKSMRQIGTEAGDGQAKVITTVSRGGSLRVAGGPNDESLGVTDQLNGSLY